MLSIAGQPHNIVKSCLGKITRCDRPLLSRRKYVYVSQEVNKKPRLYSGLITSQQKLLGDDKGPSVLGVDPKKLALLKDGDIVLLEPNGNVNILWDTDSQHNSILTTQDCNCHCIMCPQPRQKDSEGFLDLNIKLISLLDPRKTKRIGITGGEPTLLRQGLVDMLLACKKRVPKASVTLLTNGRTLKDLDLVKRLVDVGHPDLCICIPLYADNDKEHDRIMGAKGSFYETVKGITNLALFRQRIEIRNVIHALTYERLSQYADFIYRNFPFLVHVALMGMETTGLALKNLEKLWIDPTEYMSQLKSAVMELHRRGLNVSVYNLQLCILPTELWQFSRRSISTWKNVYLDMCEKCSFKEECAGFFETSGGWHSKNIHALKELDFAENR